MIKNITKDIPIKMLDEKVYFKSLISNEITKGLEKIRLTIVNKKINCRKNIISLNINLYYLMHL
tara:strand:+ start:706 stop:897 length:192 start_codon:yes stop_codon:yes gene_type:complete